MLFICTHLIKKIKTMHQKCLRLKLFSGFIHHLNAQSQIFLASDI